MKHYLVQRLTSKNHQSSTATGFDRLFELEYMGSSEFEWGAIPKALKQMREKPVKVQAQPVTIDGLTRDVFFVGHAARLESPAADIEAWASADFRGKESSHFPEVFSGATKSWHRTDAWWSIEDYIAFALTADVAHKLVRAFNEIPATS